MTLDRGLTTMVKGHFSFGRLGSDEDGLSAGEIVEMLHTLLHKCVLLLARTVAGVIRCFLFIQPMGNLSKLICEGELGEMEPTDKHIGGKPIHDI